MRNYDYFEKLYKEFLLENHPDFIVKMGNSIDEHVWEKSKKALEIYENERLGGKDPISSLENAREYLQEGKKFSRYNVIVEILQENFPEIYERYEERNKLKILCINIINECEDILKKHDNDNFAYSDKLNNDLIKRIKTLNLTDE